MEKAMRTVIRLAPDHAQAYNFIGYSLVERHSNLVEAQKLLSKALSLSPDNPEILDSIGWLRHVRGDNLQALEYLQKAHTALPDNAAVSAHLGQVLWSLGRHTDARQVWQSALQKHPDDATLKSNLARQP
jgi:Flp pilus assembly protein TadD, contains TPR repeats